MPEKDISEKFLEDYPDVFADIVNGLLFEGEQRVKPEDLLPVKTLSRYHAEGRLRTMDRDVSKYLTAGGADRVRVHIALIGYENETEYDRDMPFRVVGYDGASYRAQLDGNFRCPVLTLVLYFGDRRWGKNRSLYDALTIPEAFRPYVNDYKINLFEIAHLPASSVDNFHSDFRVVVDYFINHHSNPDYRPSDPVAFRHVEELLALMRALTCDDRFTEVLTDTEGRPGNMSEVLDRIEAKGRREGEAKGRREGEAKGRREGEAKGRREGRELALCTDIRSLMKNLHLSLTEAMDALSIPTDDRTWLLQALK